MKTKKTTTKRAARQPKKKTTINVNHDYLQQCVDDAIATIMALNALVGQLAAQLKEANK